MRVLHLVKTGRGAKWAQMQMRELVASGIDVHVAMPPEGVREPEYHRAGVTVHHFQSDFPISRPHRFPGLARQFRDLVDHVNPDIIHSHFVGTTLTMRLALGRHDARPRIFQVPGPLHLEHPFFGRAEVAASGRSDFWFGTCRWTCEKYCSMGVEEERVFLRYYGKDLDQLPPTLSTGKLRSEIHVPENSKVVGMVAYMYPPKRYLGHRRGIKGHEDLIDALKICLDEGANVAGVFVGGGTKPGHPYERRVRGYAAERLGERGIFLGNRNDVPELYPEFDVAVHPSHSENQGGAAESLLLQIPTIATDVGGFPDIVHPGITGELVPARDPSRLAEAILSTLDNPERSKKMAMQGAMVMREIGDAKKNAAKVLNTYQEILS